MFWALSSPYLMAKTELKKTNIGLEQLDDITASKYIHIMPKVVGSDGKVLGAL
jgi:hypothetical protein